MGVPIISHPAMIQKKEKNKMQDKPHLSLSFYYNPCKSCEINAVHTLPATKKKETPCLGCFFVIIPYYL